MIPKTLSLLCLSLAVCASASVFAEAKQPPVVSLSALSKAEGSKPNILILYADDRGDGDLAIQNPDSKIPMPHLDKLG